MSWFRRTRNRQSTRTPVDPAYFKRLPRQPKLRDTIASHPVTPAADPHGGRDTERDFVIRYGDPFDE